MPYPPRQIPDAPVPGSMIPRASTLHGTDIVVIVQPVNDPGQKTRTMTLSQLAAFISGGGLDSITFVGAGGYTTTVDGNGVKYHKDATPSDQAIRDYAIDTDGVHVSVTTPNYTKKFETDGTKAVITKTESGLTDKVEVFDNYIQVTHQTRVNNQVVTQTSKFGWDELRARILRVMIDENNAIPLYWDNSNNELVIWDRQATNTVALPRVHVMGLLTVEGNSKFKGAAEFEDYVLVKKGADIRSRGVFERINAGSTHNYFEVSDDTDINNLLTNDELGVEVGDIVTVHNTSTSAVTVDLGTRQGGGGIETKSTTLNALCAMQFMCCLKQTTQSETYVQWVPLGNATVTWA